MPEQTSQRETPRIMRLRDLLGEAAADAAALYDAKQSGRARGAVTNLPKLDAAIGGILNVGLHIIHGTPGSGKTALALQIAATCGCPCLLITCEMRPLVLLKRLAARSTRTFLGRFSSGELHPNEAGRFYTEAVASAPNLAILDATTAFPSIAFILEAAQTVRQLDPANPHLLIVLDSIHAWADAMGGADNGAADATEYDRTSEACSAFRKLATALGCAVLATCERNRASMEKGGQSAGAGSRKLEYSSETVFGLEAKLDEPEDRDGERPVTVRLHKNRNGAAGARVEMAFHGALQQFREVR